MSFFSDWGYLGLFLGCFLAATIVPFSSDALFVASLGLGGNIYLTLLWATLGNWMGGISSYWVGYAGKWKWIEKWLRIKPETLYKQKAKIDKYGSWLALLSWLPIVGDVFAVGLGFYRVNFYSSAFFMLIGKTIRFAFIAIIFIYFKDKLNWLI